MTSSATGSGGLRALAWSTAAAALLLFGARGAAGQVADTATTPDSIRPVATLDPIVATASRVPLRADQIGLSTSVLTEGTLDRRNNFNVYDELRSQPGFFLDEQTGPGGPTVIRLRGGEEFYTQVRVDGVEVNQRGGFFDLRGWGLSNVGRVEVARGPQSALYGTSAVNGVVHFMTPMARAGSPSIRIEGEGGAGTDEDERLRGSVEVSGGSESFRYLVGGGASFMRGIFELPHDEETFDAATRLDFLPSQAWRVTARGRFVATESMLPVRDPGVTRVPLDPNARDEKDRIVSSLEAEYRPSDAWTHSVKLTAFNEDGLFEDQRDDIAQPSDFFVFNFDFALASDFWRTGGEWVSTWNGRDEADGSGVAVSVGARWEQEDLHTEQTGEFGDAVRDLDRDVWSGFAEIQGSVAERWDVLLGGRVDDFQGIDAEFSPRLSTVYHLVDGVVDVRGAVGKSFKAPNLERQFPDNGFIASNPDLGPETSVSWEIGTDLTLAEGRVRASLTYFDQTFEDLIRTVPNEGDNRGINVNLGESDAQGFEWLLRYGPSTAWAVGTEGAWLDTEMIDNRGLGAEQFPEGEELPFRPDVRASLFFELLGWEGVSGMLRGTFVGEQIVLSERFSGSREPIDSYVLVDLSANYRVSEGVELFTRLGNLLDEQYQTGFDRPGIDPRGTVGLRFETR